MTELLRERTEHAAKYGANLVVPAREIKQLFDEVNDLETAREAEANARDDARSEARQLREDLDRAHLSASLHLEARAALDAVRQLLADADRHQNAFIQTGHLRNALDAAALAEGGEQR